MTLFNKWLVWEYGNGFSQIKGSEKQEELISFLIKGPFKSDFYYGSKIRANANAKRVLKFLEGLDQETITKIDFAGGSLSVSVIPHQ